MNGSCYMLSSLVVSVQGTCGCGSRLSTEFFLQNNHYPRAVSPLFQHGSDGHGEDIAIVLNPVWYALKIVVSQNTLYSRSIERLSQLCSAPNILYSDMTIRSDRWWC